MIKSVQFENFKALENFSITIKDFNILVGVNNCGKSTILDAFRVLQGAYRYASRKNPTLITIPDGSTKQGYHIPINSIPIILENVQTNFSDDPAIIKYKFYNRNELILLFYKEFEPILYFECEDDIPRSSKSFRTIFPLDIAVIPTLGPLEIKEEVLDLEYVKRWSGSRRAPRMFRNIWFHDPLDFEIFKNIIETTWENTTIQLPKQLDPFNKELSMFCEENRMTREVCWAGFGFQIWLQLITHIVKSRNAELIIVDEPEIYLHPDLQHKIYNLLKSLDSTILLATHSSEIINIAEPADVVIVDKKFKSGKRISDIQGLQLASNIIGSKQNIHLTRLAKGKKIMFVEGKDLRILRRFIKIVGIEDLDLSEKFTIIPIEGFTKYEKVKSTNWTFSRILGEDVVIAALFDRDYRTDDEIASITEELKQHINYVHILNRKEIENYLLEATLLKEAVKERIDERLRKGYSTSEHSDIDKVIEDTSNSFKDYVNSQLLANLLTHNADKSKDHSTKILNFNRDFNENWKNLKYRFKVIPGKEMLSKLNEQLSYHYKVNLSLSQIAACMKRKDLDPELEALFINLKGL